MNTSITFTTDPIQIPGLELPSREIGSVLEFHGLVREKEGDALLPGLFYEAHEPMARKLLDRHFVQLAAQYPIDSVCFIHRLGHVPVGEASLYLRVLSSHRAEGLAFLAEAVIRLKQDVPIWKMPSVPAAPDREGFL
jgi:molybdopterin synthase catalytic subunit